MSFGIGLPVIDCWLQLTEGVKTGRLVVEKEFSHLAVLPLLRHKGNAGQAPIAASNRSQARSVLPLNRRASPPQSCSHIGLPPAWFAPP